MLKKLLYNKYRILNIPERLNLTSEEFLKILFDLKNVIMFEYKKELRLTTYSGYDQDYLGRALKWQPIALAGGEVYKIKTKANSVKYRENPLTNIAPFSRSSYIIDDIQGYIDTLNALDKSIIINSKQVFLPFIARTNGQSAQTLKLLLSKILGKEYQNLILDGKLTDTPNGLVIEPTNMQIFLQQIQDTKKKVLDEAFFYLGISSAQGKLAHQSELEIESYNTSVDLLDRVIFDKINDFILKCNEMFNEKMILKRV